MLYVFCTIFTFLAAVLGLESYSTCLNHVMQVITTYCQLVEWVLTLTAIFTHKMYAILCHFYCGTITEVVSVYVTRTVMVNQIIDQTSFIACLNLTVFVLELLYILTRTLYNFTADFLKG